MKNSEKTMRFLKTRRKSETFRIHLTAGVPAPNFRAAGDEWPDNHETGFFARRKRKTKHRLEIAEVTKMLKIDSLFLKSFDSLVQWVYHI